MAYADETTFRARVTSASGDSPARIATVLAVATRAVDDYTHRNFTVPTAATARVFAAPDNGDDVLYTHDIANTIGLVVVDNGTALVNGTDFQLEPLNAVWPNGAVGAYTSLRRIAGAWTIDSRRAAKITVTARWGWPATPEGVVEATLLIAADLWNAKDARFGVQSFVDGGYARVRENAMACSLLDPYVSYARAGIA